MTVNRLTFWIALCPLLCAVSFLQASDAAVVLVKSDAVSFVLQSGEYTASYAPLECEHTKGWITIARSGIDGPAIATKLANGAHLDVTDAGAGEKQAYSWKQDRKDSRIFRDVRVAELEQAIEITIASSRQWADFRSTLTAYKDHPGLLHWKVTADAKTDKAFSGGVEPDCFFLTKGPATVPSGVLGTHDTVRYMTQRGPASGIVYFRDLPLDSLVFYFEDFSSLASLYRLTGADNPYDYPAPGNPGAVKLGEAESWFQQAGDGSRRVPPTAFPHDVKAYRNFGYHRPFAYRVPKGTSLVLSDTYLYLRPAPDAKQDNALVCRNFVEMLAGVYPHIDKPEKIATDWADDIVPKLCADIMRPGNFSMIGDKFYPRAYVSYEHADAQLWTLAQLLCPLTEYVNRYPDRNAPAELKRKLESSLRSFYDEEYRGFHNNLPPIKPDMFFHTVYILNPAMMVADLALVGNKDARYMIEGFKDRLLKMGRTCDYVFGNVWLDDFSKMNSYYQFDATGAYIYVMMALHELSGSEDVRCLNAARAATERMGERCMDLGWQVNMTCAGAVGCEKLYQATGNERYRELMYIPLANTLQQAWLWECDYGIGEKTTTFWAFCGTPGAPSGAEYESHRARVHFRQLCSLCGSSLGREVTAIIHDAWRYGPTQSRFALPPILVDVGAEEFIAREGSGQTNCGQIRYDQMLPLEDVNAGWATDLEWWNNNSKPGVVGQEIYGAGGPIWYALWQRE